MAVDVGVEAAGEGDGPLEVAVVSSDFVSTLEPPISSVTSVFSSFFSSGIVLVPIFACGRRCTVFLRLVRVSFTPDLPRPLRLEILLKDEAKLRESSSERDERDCELERAGDPLFDGFDEAAGDELDDSSSDTDVDADESSLIIILS